MSKQDLSEKPDTSHLADVPDGAGCAEIWDHLSDERDQEYDEQE